MFEAWGRFVYRHRWPVLAISVVVLLISGFVAGQGGKLESGGFIETAESGRASRLIEQELPIVGGSTFTLIFSSDTLSAEDPEFRAAVETALVPLRTDPRVDTINSPYDPANVQAARQFSNDKRSIAVDVAVKDSIDIARDYYPEMRAKVRSDKLRVQATGVLAINNGFNVVLLADLQRAEIVALPLALILLLLVFGAVVAALIPLGTGLLAVMSGIAGMFLLSRITGVSVYAQNVVTLIGLGVAIDYSLFVTSRFREELLRGRSREDALAIAMSTSGRAVTFSGLTVAIGLSGMLFYEGTFLPSMGLAGAIVVASAVFYGLTFLPALLALLGSRIDRLRVPIMQPAQSGRGWWHTIATAVMRRPLLVLIPTVAFILLAGSPFLHLRLASSDVRTLPKHEESRAAFDKLVSDFPGAGQNHISVIAYYPTGSPLDRERVPQLQALNARLAAIPGVQQVQSAFAIDPRALGGVLGPPPDLATLYSLPREQLPPQLQAVLRQTVGQHIALFDVVTGHALYSDQARQLVRDLRAVEPPPGGEKLITGFTAIDLDTVNFIVERTPTAVAWVMLATIVVLFVLLGSVVLPLKAVVMNLLSISASFGALVWVFQDGNGARLLGFEAASIDPSTPVIMFCIVFGLSMDYEVLLLSRIQEEYLRTRDNTHAVAEGLERSGRLITGAAAIMVGVFGAFGLAEILLIKAIGLGMALAVAIDATLVRALVVPATMRLLGNLNWWAPRPLARLYRRLGLGEAAAPAPTPGAR
ncbi:MAG TPA: MMPL family transporter [Candidatus Limnocylindria bacterium]|nr:MMPL family transporter [Candidatus Limnocylindria bacterium]